MNEEQVPFAMAPEPSTTGGASIADPVPIPLPTPVTGLGAGGRGPRLPRAFLILAACFAGATALAIGWYAVDYISAPVTTLSVPTTSGSVSDVTTDPVPADTGATEPLVAPDPAPTPSSEELTKADGSLVDTAAAMAKGLPGFELVGEATDSGGDPMLLARSRAYPKFRIAVYPDGLDPADSLADDIVVMLKGNGIKGKRFVQYFSRLHPGVIVDSTLLDPDTESDANLLWVTYVMTVAQVGDTRFEKELYLRYDPKSQKWAPEK